MPRSLKKVALIVTFGTLLSKLVGFARQLVIANVFGISTAYDAYNYAYILPGFLLILLGGINGPFHNAMVTVLSLKSKEEKAYVITATKTLIGTVLFLVTILLILTARQIISFVGPGLTNEAQNIAIIQLQLMAPIAFFSGLIGLSFGSLNATGLFWIPAVAPACSSLSLIIGIGIFCIYNSAESSADTILLLGGITLAISTMIGAIIQWLIQLPALINKNLIKFKLIWDPKNAGVQEILKILAPASLSCGMLQINVFTDLFFVSGIAGAASALSYASLLVQAPLGIISNALIVPLLPEFSRLNAEKNIKSLVIKINQGVIISSSSMIILGSLIISLSNPLVSLIYERGAFDNDASNVVSSILIAYGIGLPAYLGRDLLIRVFYGIGDAKTPFKLSSLGIGLNIFFDWFLIGGPTPWGQQFPFNFGVTGIVIATGIINFITCIALIIKISQLFREFSIYKLSIDFIKLLSAGLASGLLAWSMKSLISWPNSLFGLILIITICGSLNIFTFGSIANYLGIKEISYPLKQIRKKLNPR